MAAPMEEEKSTDYRKTEETPRYLDSITLSGNISDEKQISGGLLEITKPVKKNNVPLSTFKVPESSVLRQVQVFLPRMAEADTKLKEKMKECSPDALNIESLDEHEGRVIEMNLAVVEKSSDSDSELSLDSTSESSDSDSDTDSVKQDPNYGPVTCRNIKIPKYGTTSKHSPKIEVLASTEQNNSSAKTDGSLEKDQ